MIVWLTGASSGLGKAAAHALKQAGHTVLGGARSFEESAEHLTLPLDVTSEESVSAFVEKGLALTGAPDALVLAQGLLVLGAAEDISIEEYKRVMEVNFFGTLRLIKKAAPLMRQNKKGRIAIFSSVNGLLATPFEGAYVASKHALEGLCECLRMELAPFRIQVMAVEPGDHRGGSRNYRPHAANRQEAYEASFLRVTERIARDEDTGSDPDALGRKLARALARKNLPARLRVASFSQQLAVLLHDILPTDLFVRMIARYYRV